jgi:ribosomal protein S1
MQKHTVGNHYVGTVSVINLIGIWVSLDSGLDCLCNFPVHGRPPIGARATVKLLDINEETGKLFGEIVFSSNL